MNDERPSRVRLETSKKASAIRHINAAIVHLQRGEMDCAITLAAAGEGMLPATDDPYLFKQLRNYPPAADIDFNLVINWLKHPVGPEELSIPEFEAVMVIARAITKFTAVYHESTRRFEQFLRWGHEAGYLPTFSNDSVPSTGQPVQTEGAP